MIQPVKATPEHKTRGEQWSLTDIHLKINISLKNEIGINSKS